MRKIIPEAKVIDGVISAPTLRDLKQLVSQQDMRGVAIRDEVFLRSAYDDTHFGMRNDLGLPPHSQGFGEGADDQGGFNFYATASHVYHEWEDAKDDDRTMNGREDWVSGGPPKFDIDGVSVWLDCKPEVALANRQFARMVGRSPTTIREWIDLVEYHEGHIATFTHAGHRYNLNRLFDLSEDIEPVRVPIDQLWWSVNEDDLKDEDRIAAADTACPILVAWWQDGDDRHRLVVLDGIHRLIAARQLEMEDISAKFISSEMLDRCDLSHAVARIRAAR